MSISNFNECCRLSFTEIPQGSHAWTVYSPDSQIHRCNSRWSFAKDDEFRVASSIAKTLVNEGWSTVGL